jgi:HEAT repeat protein
MDTGAGDIFLERLASDPSPAVRRAAAEGIGLLKFPGPQLQLTERLQKDPDPLVRAECARALGRMERKTAAPFLTFALLGDPSPEVRALSAEALARFRAPEAAEALREGMKDDDPLVRLYSIRGLVESNPSSSASLFRQVWDTTDDPEMRAEAFRGLLVSDDFDKWRETGLSDKDERVRFLALREWLSRLSRRKGGTQVLDAGVTSLIESFLSDPARGIQELAKSFLEKQGYSIRPSGFRYIIDR